MTSVSTDRRQGLNSSAAIKVPVRLATTASIAHAGLISVDGVVPSVGDRILDKDNTDATLRGIWVADTGNWSRDLDFDGPFDILRGTIVHVLDGTTNGDSYWQVTTVNPITVGSSSITFATALGTSSAMLSFLAAGAGAVIRTLQNKERDLVSVRDFGALGDGLTNDRAAFVAAEAVSDDIIVPAGTYLISTSVTLAGHYWIQRGATIKPDVGATVTITGSVEAGPNQIIDVSLGGHVALQGGKTERGPIEWWGAVADYTAGAGTDNTAAIAEAWAYGPPTILYPARGQYYLTGLELNATNSHTHQGIGNDSRYGLIGIGIDAAHKGSTVPNLDPIQAAKKFVIQNNTQAAAPPDRFVDLCVQAKVMADTVAIGLLSDPDNTNGMQTNFSSENCSFLGYCGMHLTWANNESHAKTYFGGYLAAVSGYRYTAGDRAQKVHFVHCSFNGNANAAGGGYFILQDNNLGGAPQAIGVWTFDGCDFEVASNGWALDGPRMIFLGAYVEGSGADHPVPGTLLTETADTVSTWIDPEVNQVAGVAELLSGLGANSLVHRGSSLYPGSGGPNLGRVGGSNELLGFNAYLVSATSRANNLITDSNTFANKPVEVELASWKGTFTSAAFVDTHTITMLAHQVGLLEVEFFGNNAAATTDSYFKGLRLLSCSAGTLTVSTIGTDLTDGGATTIQIGVAGLVGTLGIKAAAASTGGVVKVRMIGGGTDGTDYGATIVRI